MTVNHILSAIVRAIDAIRSGRRRLLCRLYAHRFASRGANLRFDPWSATIAYEHVQLGSNVYIGPGAIIGRAQIGNDVIMGPNVSLRDGYHRHDLVGRSIRDSGDGEPGLIVIGDDVWIGEGTAVLRGVTVGEGAVIGTKSLVARDVPPYVVAVGSPCVPKKLRFSDEALREHLEIRGHAAPEAESIIAERARSLVSLGLEDVLKPGIP